MRILLKHLICCAAVFIFVSSSFAQQQTPKSDEQDRIRIFTQEIILPIVAYDVYGHFDPTVSSDDVLVLEDGVAQQLKSARRIPLNVLLLIDMGSVVGFTQHLDITRTIALYVISKLRPGDKVALIQFTSRAEVLQDWTDDSNKVKKAFVPSAERFCPAVVRECPKA